jgi:hypothetical protein
MFDNRYFSHKTNPLFVELKLGAERIQPTGAAVREIEIAQTGVDKGKGRAKDG